MRQLEVVDDEGLRKSMHKKMAPPLVTLLSGESEIQYVALRNINLIVKKYPHILAHEVKVFFCKYNDPIYVKMVRFPSFTTPTCQCTTWLCRISPWVMR